MLISIVYFLKFMLFNILLIIINLFIIINYHVLLIKIIIYIYIAFTMKINLFIYLLTLCCISTINGQINFEKHIWAFWNGPIQSAPFMIRICYQKIKIVCQQQGYSLTLLSQANIKSYITNFEQFEYHVKNRKLHWIQSVADLVRVTVLEQHGGIWFDITSIFINGLRWIENIQQNPQLITNRNPSINKSPDMMLFYIFFYQNSDQYRKRDGGIVNILPGFQNWFIAAKKKSRVISLWKKYFSEFLLMNFEISMQKLSNENIYIRGADNNGLYLSMHKAIYYMMQKQQLQLDKNLTLFSQRQNVNHYLNIWGLHGQYGPLSIQTKLLSSPMSLMNKDKQQLKQEQFELKFYMKMTTGSRGPIENQINKTKYLVRQGITFEKFLASKPTHQQCSNYEFIVDGSVVDFLIKDNPVAKELNLFIITKQQRQRWNGYCSQLKNNLPQKSFLLSQLVQSLTLTNFLRLYVGIDAEIQPQLSRDVRENLNTYQNAQSSQIEKNYQFFQISRYNKAVIRTVTAMIACLIFFLGIGPLLTQISKIMIHSFFLKKKVRSITKEQDKQVKIQKIILNYVNQLFSFILYLVCIANGYRLSFTQVALGVFNQEFIILISMAISYYSIKNYQKVCHPQKRIPIYISALTNKEFLSASFPFFCFYLGNSIVFSIQKRPEKFVAISTFLFLVQPILIKLGKKLSYENILSQKPVNFLLKFILKYHYLSINFLFGWMILIVFIPNVKYIANQNGYLAHNVINTAILYTCIVYLAVLMQIIIKCRRLFQLQSILKSMTTYNVNCFVTFARIITSFIITSLLIYMSYSIYYQPENEQIYYTQLYSRYQSTIVYAFMCINLLVSLQYTKQASKRDQIFNAFKYKFFILLEIAVDCSMLVISFPYYYQIFNLTRPTKITLMTRRGLVVYSILTLIWNRVILYILKKQNNKQNEFLEIQNDQHYPVLNMNKSAQSTQVELYKEQS